MNISTYASKPGEKYQTRREFLRDGSIAVGGLAAIVSGLELIRPNYSYAQEDTSGKCVVNSQSVDNCVDLIYQKAGSANDVYKGAKVVGRNILLASRHKFLFFKTGEWEKYFFDSGELSTKLQNIFREDPKVDFEGLYKFFEKFNGLIERVSLFREGYMAIGIGKEKIGGYIIPISPETVDKIKSL